MLYQDSHFSDRSLTFIAQWVKGEVRSPSLSLVKETMRATRRHGFDKSLRNVPIYRSMVLPLAANTAEKSSAFGTLSSMLLSGGRLLPHGRRKPLESWSVSPDSAKAFLFSDKSGRAESWMDLGCMLSLPSPRKGSVVLNLASDEFSDFVGEEFAELEYTNQDPFANDGDDYYEEDDQEQDEEFEPSPETKSWLDLMHEEQEVLVARQKRNYTCEDVEFFVAWPSSKTIMKSFEDMIGSLSGKYRIRLDSGGSGKAFAIAVRGKDLLATNKHPDRWNFKLKRRPFKGVVP